ncbi:copper resistance CopC family protein [Cryobacterium sp. TMT2-17-1]|uniref:copper resistance CopC family protein n=1 Tax=Cryobacterium sp. TMT2-17-1 TaxID=1259248 RepID=UPI002410FEF9|nr:copper resistance CopC family protein [Cryobacterium sp. TMT2-17-1]
MVRRPGVGPQLRGRVLPGSGAVVTEQPSLFTVTTNDALLDLGGGAGSGMLISGPARVATPLYYGDGCISLLGPTVETKAQLGQPGEYTVTWQVVSTDGHPVSGDFTFTWQPAADQALAEGSPAKPVCAETADAAADAAFPDSTDTSTVALAEAPLVAVWIAAALGAVLLAVAGTLLAIRRSARRPPNQPEQPDQPA